MHTVTLPRTCLGFTNLLFFMLGSVAFIICLWCSMNTEFFRDVNYTVTKSALVDVIANFVNLKLWVTPLTTILIPISVLAMLTSCCGVLGAGCRIKCAIKSYLFLATVITLVSFYLFFVSGVYNIYTNNYKTRRTLQQFLYHSYGKEKDFFTFIWNYIMIEHECCGVVNFKDFNGSYWQSVNPKHLYPVQCCKLANLSTLQPESDDCTYTLNPAIISYKEKGCFFALQSAIGRNQGKIIFYIILITLFYIILSLFGYCIIKGEPLLGAMAGRFTDLLPSKDQEDAKKVNTMNSTMVSSNTSLTNMMYVDDQPKRIVKVVSAVNPFQSYKFAPEVYRGETLRSHSQLHRPL